MRYLNILDYTTICFYLLILIILGSVFKKRASKSLEDYFLGSNQLPWWAMGISGMSSFMDMAGTMLIVSFLYILGPRGLYIEFRGGAVLILSFMMLWSGKWHYRSKCMTGAEWMEFRFGKSWGGQFARIISSVAIIVTTIGMLAYLIKALGIFAAMFLPFTPAQCALILISIAAIYTIVSGFYGVVYTDLFQSVIVISVIIFITVLAAVKIGNLNNLSELAAKVTGNNNWVSSALSWKVNMPEGYEAYNDLMLLAIFYLIRNMLIGISSAGADPRYFGARNERECGTLSFLWTSLMMFRWPMMIGLAVMGIILVNNFFPHHNSLLETANYIKLNLHNINSTNWSDVISGISLNPGNYSAELINGIKGFLHDNWQSKLYLLSYNGTINPEKIVPAVILFNIPMGIRGLLLVAFVAAAFSSFNSSVNTTTGYFTRDIYQRYIRQSANNKELIFASYFFIVFLVGISYLFAYSFRSITQVWGWIAMGLGGGLAVPAMLKFYWWRYNGSGFAVGTIVGIITSLLQIKFLPGLMEWQQFIIISIISLTATIVGTLLTSPVDENVVTNFYNITRPFGFWKPYKNKLDFSIKEKMEKEHRNDLIAVPFALCWQISMFFMPMQLMIHSYRDFFVSLAIFLFGLSGLYWFWYRNLPPKVKVDKSYPELNQNVFQKVM